MKKLLAMLLILAVALGLAACGSGSTTTTKPPEVLVDAAPEDEVVVEEKGEVWDGDYETATFDDIRKYGYGSTGWDGALPLTTTGEKVTIGLRHSSMVTDYDTNPQTVFFEEQTGIDIEFHIFVGSEGDIATQQSLMFSGGEPMPDILFIDTVGYAMRGEWLDAGYLRNLAGYFITDSYYFSRELKVCCGDDPVKYANMLNLIYAASCNQQTGQVYGSPNISDNLTDAVFVETCVNMEWLNKLGLQKPTTIDELYDVLVAFRDRDPNGNGKKDEIPMMGRTKSLGRGVDNYLINAFIQYAPTRKVMIEDGKVFSYHDQDEYRQALIFMNKLVKEGLLSELAFTATGSDLQRLLNPVGDEPYTVGVACAWIAGDYLDTSNSWQVYEPLPALKDAGYGRGGYSMFAAPSVATNFGITSDCENVQLAFRLLDWMHSKEAFLVQRWGEEGVDWDWIENTKYKDKAKGNGVYGGDAVYVAYTDGFRTQSRWRASCTIADERNFQPFSDPDADDYDNTFYRKSVENALAQYAIGQPEEEFHVFLRTPEEDELFQEYNVDLTSVVTTAQKEFILGRRDPNDDAAWQAYLDDLHVLKFERWAELAQASYDRQKADLDAIRAQMGK